jgi:hypothetical protein
MDVEKLTDRLPVVLGGLYLVAGVAETIRVVSSGDGGLAFWFGSLVSVGALAGMLATMWTLVVPVLAIAGWSIFGPRPRIRLRELGLAFLWPVAWLLVTFAVRAATGWVPYPFLDPDGDAGWAGVAVACVGITVLFALTALAAYAVDRRLAPRPAVPAGR